MHESDLEIEALRRVLADDPSALAPRRELAHALAAQGNPEDAIGHLLLHRNHPEVAFDLLRLSFEKTQRVSADRRNWDEVDRALELAEATGESSWPLILMKARIDESHYGADAAIQHSKDAIALAPEELELHLVLVVTALRAGRDELVRETLEAAEQRFGDDVRVESAWIHYWSWQGADLALAPLTAIKDGLEDRPEAERRHLALQLARVWVLLGAYEQAEPLWHQLADHQPENLQLQLLAFESSLNCGLRASTEAVVSRIVAIEGPDGSFKAACRVADLLSRTESGDVSDADQVRVSVELLKQLRPHWHAATALERRVFQQEGQDRRAAECYRRALETGSRDTDVLSRLLRLLCRMNRYTDADSVMRMFEPYWDDRCSHLHSSQTSKIADRPADSARSLALDQHWVTTAASGTVNTFAAEILFSDPDLEYRLIFETAGHLNETSSITSDSIASPTGALCLTDEQAAFFNAAALNADSDDN